MNNNNNNNNIEIFPYLCSQCKSGNCKYISNDRIGFRCNDCNATNHNEYAERNPAFKWTVFIPPITDNEDDLFTWEDYEKD